MVARCQRGADCAGKRNNKIRRRPPLKTDEKEVEQVTPSDPATEGLQTVIPEFIIDTMARAILPSLRAFYASPEGRAAFEEWKRQQEKNT